MSDSILRYAVIPHETEPKVLLLPGDEGWTLPFVRMERHFFPMAGPLTEAFRQTHGLDLAVMRWTYRHPAPFDQPADRVYEMENLRPAGPVPPGARWVSAAELESLPLAVPEHRTVLANWFADSASPPHPKRAPWARRGWLAEARRWIERYVTVTALEQVKVWSVSHLVKVHTPDGIVWFKASPPLFAVEDGVSELLARRYPGHIPEVIAREPNRHWLLLRDIGGHLLSEESDLSRWEETLRLYARMQVDMIPHMGALMEAGCHDRRLPVMLAQAERLLADTDALSCANVLEPAQIARLQRMGPEIRRMCEELAACGIPDTLEHGDLHPRNVAIDADGRPVIFDWSDACLSHPFFSMRTFFLWSGAKVPWKNDPSVQERLRDAYLEPWAPFAPRERLLAAYAVAQRLAHVQFALSYYWYILPEIEQQEEWAADPPYWLKGLL